MDRVGARMNRTEQDIEFWSLTLRFGEKEIRATQFNEQQNPGDPNIHCGPINAVTDARGKLSEGKPLWIYGSQTINAESLINDINGNNQCDDDELGCSRPDCRQLFKSKKSHQLK